MQIPKSFTLCGHTIKVIMEEIDLDDNGYGFWNDVSNEIVIYKHVRLSGKTYTLNNDQLTHTFFHEVRHAMQWFSVGKYDEQDAQTFASLMIEFIKSSGIKIDPNVIKETINEIYD